jgi:hypothetical protein
MTHWLTSNEGRGDPRSRNASRAALCLAPLHQSDGGHAYRDGLAWPIEDEPHEEAMPDPLLPRLLAARFFFIVVVAVLAAAAQVFA